jgi:hypothetical protein
MFGELCAGEDPSRISITTGLSTLRMLSRRSVDNQNVNKMQLKRFQKYRSRFDKR